MEAAVACTASASRVFWTPGLLARIARCLPPNDVACGIRLANRFAAAVLRRQEHLTVHLSQPCPHSIFTRRWGAGGPAAPAPTHSLNLRTRQQLICLTAASGILANLEVALKTAGCAPADAMLEAAAAAGHLEACKLLVSWGCSWGVSLRKAARGGHRAVCEWLLASGCPWSDWAAYEAARGGHLGLMDWLLQQGSSVGTPGFKPSPPALMAAAAEGCSLDSLRRLQQEWDPKGGWWEPSSEGERRWLLAGAAVSPTPDWQAKVEWLEGELGCRPSSDVFWSSPRLLQPRCLDRVLWLRRRGYPLPCEPMFLVRLGNAGNTALLRLLSEEGALLRAALPPPPPPPPPPQQQQQQAQQQQGGAGGVWVQQQQQQQQHPHQHQQRGAAGRAAAAAARRLLSGAAQGAAAAGHLAFLQVLFEHGYLRACHSGGGGSGRGGGRGEGRGGVGAGGGGSGGGGGGDVSSLKALANLAARGGHLSVVTWLVEVLRYDVQRDTRLFRAAAASGSTELMGWLWDRGARARDADFDVAVKRGGCEEALTWMAIRGFRLMGDPVSLCAAAARNGDLSTLRWLWRRWQQQQTAPTAGQLLPSLDWDRLIISCLWAPPGPRLAALRWLAQEPLERLLGLGLGQAPRCPPEDWPVDWRAAELEAKAAAAAAGQAAAAAAAAAAGGLEGSGLMARPGRVDEVELVLAWVRQQSRRWERRRRRRSWDGGDAGGGAGRRDGSWRRRALLAAAAAFIAACHAMAHRRLR
ncbi:hypothetical protein PLESTB_001298900 [Pleodorina starrii]|uniref:Ankyrin repeat domain-containing protein n=1 Tax=Pleodorina starrii TaxID=330485 RepID=A0A9W6F6X2_9CHLO|nr:hypothetical protein PLESTM_000856800 [Pleodorina starrii]GLC57961.1 hypothetical protein PLESTB_001298900 [Pleodorina starrii]GLC76757.1 hypothetical protein PLESTF_001830300 [Pleodorina starrii]